MSLTLHWVNKRTSGVVFDLGYAHMNKQLMACVGTHFPFTNQSSVAFHVSSPRLFRPIRGKKNVLMSMWEGEDFPESQRPYLWNVDYLIVPSTFCAKIFEGKVDCPIEVVPLGVDSGIFTSKRRIWQPGDSFQWLNVGAPNDRKGWFAIEQVWNQYYLQREDTHLYCKFAVPYNDPKARAKFDGYIEYLSDVFYRQNTILDFRYLPIDALVRTFHNSHAFLFPTAGEGFGLTLLEAMATGLPCIVTKYSGVLEFTSEETVQYVSWSQFETELQNADGTGVILNCALADVEDVHQKMQWIMNHYFEAVKMGKRAMQQARRFTWQRTGQQIAKSLTRYFF